MNIAEPQPGATIPAAPVPLATADDVRRHIEVKLAMRELREPVAEQMLAALDNGATPDYPALLKAAMFPDPPPVVYHTAPVTKRDSILGGGLEVSQPGEGGSWEPHHDICKMLQASQPPGVYVTAQPDARGLFAHWPRWDVWEIHRGNLPWQHDTLNPGCGSLAEDVPTRQVHLLGTFGPEG